MLKKDTRKFKPLVSGSTNEYNSLRQEFNIKKWCKEQGLDLTTIETHPRLVDVRALLDFDIYDGLMTKKDKEIWTHAWNWVYKKQLPISVYIEQRLLSIVENCQRTKYIRDRKMKQARRSINEMKSDHNDKAKGSHSASGLNLQSTCTWSGSGN